MKKIIILLFGISICLILSLSFADFKTDKNELEQISVNNASTQATPEIDITSEVPAKTANVFKLKSGELSMTSPYKTDEEKFNVDNSVVIYGKVISTDYVLKGSTVFTKSKVEILKCYKGDLKTGETVSVKELGGFVPSDILSDAINKEKLNATTEKNTDELKLLDIRAEGFKVMEKGEEVILFLIPMANTDDVDFENCYEPLRLWQGKLLYEEKYNAFVPYCPAWDLAKDNTANDNATVKIKNIGENKNGAQARTYTLEEFNSFAEQIK